MAFSVLDEKGELRDSLLTVVTSYNWGPGCEPVANGRDAYEFVLSANVHRRHPTGEQKRELIAKGIEGAAG